MDAFLRELETSDYPTIASWIRDSHACSRWAGSQFQFPFTAQELPALLAANESTSFVFAENGSSPVAFGQYFVPAPGVAHLGRIIVSPISRGHGYGRLLCQQLIERAFQATAATAVTLRVYRDNPAAIALYSNLGFAPIESQSSSEVHFMELRPNPSIERTR